MFRIGQKVVCVNAGTCNGLGPVDHELTEGNIYTITWVGLYRWRWNNKTYSCVGVSGCPTRKVFPQDCPFMAERFRPLEERKTDISIFTAMLKPKKITEKA